MPIFKVVMTETETKTITAYVEAESEDAAENWGAEVEAGETVGNVTNITDDGGTLELVEPVSGVPAGFQLVKVQ